jgi:hypothetical protein
MQRWIILGLCTLLLAGCASTYPFTRDPRLELEAWTRDTYGCKMAARQGFYFGHPLWIEAQLNVNWKACMVDGGWFIPVQPAAK